MHRISQRRRALTSVVVTTGLVLGTIALAIAASTTTAGAVGGCFGSQVPNTVTKVGSTYVVGASPGVTFTASSLPSSSSKIKWTLNAGHEQKAISTLYESSQGSSSDTSSNTSTREVVKSKSGRTLTSLTVCTTPIPPPTPPTPPSCPSGQVPNTLTKVGSSYVIGATPHITFNAGSLTSGSSITWTVNPTFTQKYVAATYRTGNSSSGTGNSTTTTTISKTRNGLALVALTVCTIPTPPPNPPQPPNPPSSGGCGTGNVQNVALRAGSNYADQTSPGLTFSKLSGLTGDLEWDVLGTVDQVDGGVAVYDGGVVRSVDDNDDEVDKRITVNGSSRQLIVVTVCTTAPPP